MRYFIVKAEYLYNKICKCTLDLEIPDSYIEVLKTEYKDILDILVRSGIGGVKINGIFRDLSN